MRDGCSAASAGNKRFNRVYIYNIRFYALENNISGRKKFYTYFALFNIRVCLQDCAWPNDLKCTPCIVCSRVFVSIQIPIIKFYILIYTITVLFFSLSILTHLYIYYNIDGCAAYWKSGTPFQIFREVLNRLFWNFTRSNKNGHTTYSSCVHLSWFWFWLLYTCVKNSKITNVEKRRRKAHDDV